ncbi:MULTISPECIES: extracellular solute-binding protein [Pacificibacter]|uniref:extracellular solute-binding protein n=1 Tax=Pacificibacter TaxID=1042323 RepID=UPI001C092CD0|nr:MULTISPECIES: extracellular solute-binding protein [Pacificibacter]MBU2936501.1 extracellular solute-binding protein [Pacificibacter marinus]MDO6614697.1 extracellular solute-binding protein [Pacificibacter sp. 1_MG-2023]
MMNTKCRVVAFTTLVALGATTAAVAEPITVYTPQGEERGIWITEQAAAAGHEIEILSAGGGELFDRILAEKANPQADVVFGLIDAAMASLKTESMFQAYEPAWAQGLPAVYRDDVDNMVYKFWQTPIVLAYNADAMDAAGAPTSWLDLTKPEFSGKYVIGSSAWQTTKSYLVGILVRFADENGDISDEGWTFMQDLYDNAIVVESGDAKTAAFVNGDAVIDLNWFGGVGRQAADVGYTATIVDTEGGTPFISEGIAIIDGTDQLDAAKAFVDWFGSPEFMIAYAEEFGQVPVHPEAVAGSPMEVQANATLVSPQDIDWDDVAPKIDGWMQRIELEIK